METTGSAHPQGSEEHRARIRAAAEGSKLGMDFAAQARYLPGRRSFFQYRSFGVEEASGGRMRASQNTSIADMVESTGWHYHDSQFQFVYVLRGVLVVEFEDGTCAHFGAGDAFYIPGGMRHNEVYVSADKDAIEVSMPSTIGTFLCERPAGLPATLRNVGNPELFGLRLAA